MEIYTKAINQVYETNDYHKFRKLAGNRPLKKSEKLKDSLKRNGQLQPIVVNKFYEVLDGQHRLESLKELNLPVTFIIDNKYKPTHVVDMNNTQNGWTDEHYLNFYAKNGNKEYIRMSDFYKSHSLTLSLVIVGGMNRRSGSAQRVRNVFKAGFAYMFNNTEKLHNFDIFYRIFLEQLKMKNSSGLESALWTLYTTEAFNEKRMIQKAISRRVKDDLFGMTKESLYLEVLLNAHNHMLKEDSQFYIEHSRNSKNSLIIK